MLEFMEKTTVLVVALLTVVGFVAALTLLENIPYRSEMVAEGNLVTFTVGQGKMTLSLNTTQGIETRNYPFEVGGLVVGAPTQIIAIYNVFGQNTGTLVQQNFV